MIWLLLRKCWPVLAAAAMFIGAWIAWQHHGTARYEAGQAEVVGRWQASDKIALAVGNETTALLKRANAQNTGVLDAKLKGIEQATAARALGYADDARTIDGLRLALDARAATPPSDNAACPAARSDEIKLRGCEALVAGSLALAQGSRRLVDEGENLLERADITITALQDWSRLVQSANEAP